MLYKLDYIYQFEDDPNEIHYVYSEGCILWSSETKEKWAKALAKVKKLYPDEYYHRGLHTTKEFSGITVYLKDRVPTEHERELTEIEGVPVKITTWLVPS